MSQLKILNLIFFIILSYFTFYSLYGNRGYFSYIRYKKLLEEHYVYLNKLRAEKLALINNLRLLDLNAHELDLLDEYSRKILGYVAKDELFFNVNKIENLGDNLSIKYGNCNFLVG